MTTRLIKRLSLLVVVSLLTGWGSWAQSALIVSVSMKQPVHGICTKEKAAQLAAQASATNQAASSQTASTTTQTSTTNNGIPYWGGPVLNKPTGVNVYYIWYGDWSSNPGAKQVLTDLAHRIGGSPYFNINTTYYDYDKELERDPVFNKVNLVASVDDHYSVGTSLSDFGVDQLVANHLGEDLPIDENGVYFVLTSVDVNQQEFCSTDCAWHNAATVSFSNLPGTRDIKVVFIGNPLQCPGSCLVQDAPSPNNNPDADSMASFVAHELEESVTDPDGNAWHDINFNENADLCEWTFGDYLTLPSGAFYNMKLGNRYYLIQRNWVNAKGGYCALSWADD